MATFDFGTPAFIILCDWAQWCFREPWRCPIRNGQESVCFIWFYSLQFHVPLASSQHSNCVCNRYCFSSFRMWVCASVFSSSFHPSGRSPSSPIFFTGLHRLASVPWTFERGEGYVTRIFASSGSKLGEQHIDSITVNDDNMESIPPNIGFAIIIFTF